PTPRSGTMVVPNLEGSPAAAPTPPGMPRAGTLIVNQPEHPDDEYSLVDEPRGPTRLVAVPIGTPPGSHPAAEPRLIAVPIGEPGVPGTPNTTGAKTWLTPQVWIAGGVGAGLALVTLVGVLALAPRGDKKTPVASAPAEPRVFPAFPTRAQDPPPATKSDSQ